MGGREQFGCPECGASSVEPAMCAIDRVAHVPVADPLIGTTVGRYRLARVLGRGGMGTVYAAMQPDVRSRVAVKVIAEESARDPELLARFLAEARAVGAIRHESIVSVIDLAALPDGRPVIVMELVDGRTLREIVKTTPQMPMGGLVQVMVQVLSALAAAHAIGIVHRDLKPDNIIVTPGGQAKVLDFGIAKLGSSVPGGTGPRTRTGVLLGTPEYMAPEQISAGVADLRTDVYAAGVVLFEAITGRRPFDGPTDFEVMRAHLETPPPRMRVLRPDVPIELEQVIACALAKVPHDRFASAGALANALHVASAALAADQWVSLTSRHQPVGRPSQPLIMPAPHASVLTMPAITDPQRSLVTMPAMPSPQRSLITKPARPGRRARVLVPTLAAIGACGIVAAIVAGAAARKSGAPPAPVAAITGPRDVVVAAAPVVAPPPPPQLAQYEAVLAARRAAPIGSIDNPLYSTLEHPDHFDLMPTLPLLEQQVHRIAPDAVLTSITLEKIYRDGTLPLDDRSPSLVLYRSPAASSAAERAAAIDDPMRGCVIVVQLRRSAAMIYRQATTNCDAPPLTIHCHPSVLFAKAKFGADVVRADVALHGESRRDRQIWVVDDAASDSGALLVDDDCTP